MWFTDLGTVLKQEFDPQGYQINSGQISYWILYLAAFFASEASMIVSRWGIESGFDNTKSKQVLGIEYCDIN